MKTEDIANVFLNLANFVSHAFMTLAPPSGYALNLKAFIKVSQVSWTFQLSYETLKSSIKKKIRYDQLHCSEKYTSQKPASFRVKKQFSHFRTIRPLCSFAISAQWRREWNELPWFFCYVWVCLNRREQKKTLLSHFSVIAKHSIFYHCSPANILCVHYGAALPFSIYMYTT